MADGFVMSVPADVRYRGLAAEVAARYAELAGGSAADGAALARAVGDAVERAAATGAADLELEFESTPADVGVTLRYAGHSAVVRHRLSVGSA